MITRGRVLNMLLVLACIAAIYLLLTNPAEASVTSECERWAYDLGEDNYPDSYLMHTIGCDNSGETFAPYVRGEGRCAAIARNAYRTHELQPGTAMLDTHMILRGCDTMEDGSYDDLRAHRT